MTTSSAQSRSTLARISAPGMSIVTFMIGMLSRGDRVHKAPASTCVKLFSKMTLMVKSQVYLREEELAALDSLAALGLEVARGGGAARCWVAPG